MDRGGGSGAPSEPGVALPGDAHAAGAARWVWIPVLLAALQLVVQLVDGLRGVEHVVVTLFQDDTYYYLQTAWNLHRLGMVSFDGLHATNGIQLLWFAVVWLLTFTVTTKSGLVTATVVACAVLNAAGHLPIVRAGIDSRRPELALTASAAWCATTLSRQLYLRGMENSLHAFIIWLLVWQLARFHRRLAEDERPSLLPVTVLLVLNAWTRLDAALVSAAVLAFCVATLLAAPGPSRPPLWERLRTLPAAIAVAAGGAVLQLAAFWWMGGSIVPVSAVLKTHDFQPASGTRVVASIGELMARSFPELGLAARWSDAIAGGVLWLGAALLLLGPLLARRLQSRWLRLAVGLIDGIAACAVLWVILAGDLTVVELLGLLALTLLVSRWLAGAARPARDAVGWLWTALAVGFAFYHVLAVPLGMRPGYYSPWYQAPAHVFWIVGVAALVGVMTRLQPAPLARRAVAVGAGVALAAAVASAAARAVGGFERHPRFEAGFRAARFMAAEAPVGAVFGSWNAGLVGFFSDRTVVNLDGLVNDCVYARALREPGFRILDYLVANGIRYVVDWAVPDELLPELEPRFSFPTRPGWKPVVIYEVRSSRSASR